MPDLIKTAALRAIVIFYAVCSAMTLHAQDDTAADTDDYQIRTLFPSANKSVGGYGALTNKFTYIDGHFANLVGAYGGVFVNHQLMLGVSAQALTNDIRVPFEHSMQPLENLSYMYGQVGGIAEYVLFSDKAIHAAFSMFAGAGFTLQYERDDWYDEPDDFDWNEHNDEDWFFVAEPGVMIEFNVFKWMRFSPGISYRAAFNSDGRGLGDNALSNISYNATLKFGRF